jgi:hypothetical protein
MLCQRLHTEHLLTKRNGFTTSIMFISHVVCLGLRCFVLCDCFFVLYLFISRLLFGFLIFFVFVNIFLQQSILSCSFPTLLGLHCLVVYCCFLVLYLLISFVVVWIFDFFVSLNFFFTTIHLFLEYGY